MNTALRFLAISLSLTVAAGSARAQYVAPVAGAPPSETPAIPSNPVAPTTPSVMNPLPAENLGMMPCQDGPWLLVAPYGWVPGTKGTIAAGQRSTHVDLSVGDAIRDVLPDAHGALMLHVEGGVDSVGFIADLMYLNIRPLDGFLRVDSKSAMLELLGFYRVLDGRCTFDVLVGGRYYDFTNTITVQPIDFAPANRTTAWWDAVVGVRGSVHVNQCLALFARADYGGFDISGSSKRSCNVVVGIDWQCSDCVSIYGGYKWLKIDHTEGAGLNYSKIDMTLSGPFAAVGLRF